jgi:acyl dehydratase
MTDDAKAELRRHLDALVGAPTGSGEPAVAPDPVNPAMIRHWAYALDDMNPVYLDEDFAKASRYGALVSPPVMLQTWTMGSPKLEGIRERGGVAYELTHNPMDFLDEAGYVGIIATNSEFEIMRYPRVGDEITSETVFETISDEKHTAKGPGFFITWISTYRNQDGEVLGYQRFRVLRFKPDM